MDMDDDDLGLDPPLPSKAPSPPPAPTPADRPDLAPLADDDPDLAERPPSFVSKQFDKMRPGLHRAWVNLRVWLPWLMNPFERKRLIRFNSRENRVGFDWKLDLPVQCWKCGEETDLKKKKYSTDVRCFEYPVQIGLGALATFILFAILAPCMPGWSTALLMLMVPVLAVLLFRVKSWNEHVDMVIWSCPEHRSELALPDMAAYDEELHVSLPSAGLAKAARTEQTDRRRGNRPPDTGRPPRDTD
ncbi:MAG: hypothetical protein AB7O62_04975 [Pirellulales bacterium]